MPECLPTEKACPWAFVLTVFPQPDATATNYFIPQEREATIRERPLNEGDDYYLIVEQLVTSHPLFLGLSSFKSLLMA